jgi:hypothetical protein
MKTTLGRRAKVVNEENVDFFHGTVQFTGGQTFQRRYENNYSKTSHAQADRDAAEARALGPDMSLPSTLGGVREI